MHPFRSAIEAGEPDGVLELVSPDVVFNSPVVAEVLVLQREPGVVMDGDPR